MTRTSVGDTDHDRRYGSGAIALICIITFVSVLLYGAVDSGTLVILALFSVLLLVYWISVSLKQRSLTISADIIQIPLVALLAFGFVQLIPIGSSSEASLPVQVSTSLSLDPYATRFFVCRLFLCLIFFAAALTFTNTLPRLRTVAFVFIIFFSLLAFFSILQRVEDPSSIYGLRQPAQAIPFGTFINRHHFAALMEMILGLSLGILFSGGLSPNRWPFIAAASIVMAIAIFLTGSRGGLIGLVASLIAIAVFTAYGSRGKRSGGEMRSISPKLILAAGAGFLIVTIGLVSFLGGTDPLLRSTGLTSGAGDFSSGRTEFWRTAIKIFLDHPVAGVGLDSFGVAYSMYDKTSGLFRVEQAHNDYLQILADAGVLGFACVAGFILLLLKNGLRTIRSASSGIRRGIAIGALAGCVAIMVHSFFDFPLRTPANAFVFLTLAAMCVVKIPEGEGKRRSRRRKET